MNIKLETWKRKRSETIADCRVFKVRKDFSARESDFSEHAFFCIESPEWVNVIPLTRQNEVILIQQYRHGIEEITLEIPGGMIDKNESPETAASRELLEETGFATNENLIYLGKSRPNPAIQNNWVHHFLAPNCEKIKETSFDAHESIVIKPVALSQINNLILSAKISHSLVIAAFHFFSLNKQYES